MPERERPDWEWTPPEWWPDPRLDPDDGEPTEPWARHEDDDPP